MIYIHMYIGQCCYFSLCTYMFTYVWIIYLSYLCFWTHFNGWCLLELVLLNDWHNCTFPETTPRLSIVVSFHLTRHTDLAVTPVYIFPALVLLFTYSVFLLSNTKALLFSSQTLLYSDPRLYISDLDRILDLNFLSFV